MKSRVKLIAIPPIISVLVFGSIYQIGTFLRERMYQPDELPYSDTEPRLFIAYVLGALLAAIIIHLAIILPLWPAEIDYLKRASPQFLLALVFLFVIIGLLFGCYFTRQGAGWSGFIGTSLAGTFIPITYLGLNIVILSQLEKKK